MKVKIYSMLGIKKYTELFPEYKDQHIASAIDCQSYYCYQQSLLDKKIKSLEMLPGFPDMIIKGGGFRLYKRHHIPYDQNGIYLIGFGNGQHVILVKWLQGGYKLEYMGVLVGMESDLKQFTRLMDKERKRKQKPKAGIYRAFMVYNVGLQYEKKKPKQIPKTQVIHPALGPVKEHLAYYFDNVEKYCINNMAGLKAVLLHGPQGTGKTSMAYQIALEHKDDKCVAFTTDVASLYAHIHNCAKYNMPTIAIFEDCEEQFSENNGQVKNFLSGVDAPQNKAGSYMIFTTNYPKKIESTIIRRKGRIDRLFNIAKLGDEYLDKCVDLYFTQHTSLDEIIKIKKLLAGKELSGSEVETIASESLAYAAKQGKLQINAALVRELYNQMIQEINDINYGDDEYEMTPLSGRKKLGF